MYQKKWLKVMKRQTKQHMNFGRSRTTTMSVKDQGYKLTRDTGYLVQTKLQNLV